MELNVVDDGTTTNENRLGSMGDVRFVARRHGLNDDVLIINGDNLFTFSLKPLLTEFRRRGNTIALYDVGSPEVARLYGIPTLDEDHRVVDFVEKPDRPSSTLASIGIYVYRREVHQLLAKYLSAGLSPDKTGEFVQWLHKQTDVFGYGYGDRQDVWFDIGTLDQLRQAGEQWRAFESQPFPDPAAAAEAMEAAIRRLESIGKPFKCSAEPTRPATPSFAFLVKHLIADDANARVFATDVFKELGSPAAVSWLLDVLDDDRPASGTSVSAAAADALVKLGYADTIAAVRRKAAERGFLGNTD